MTSPRYSSLHKSILITARLPLGVRLDYFAEFTEWIERGERGHPGIPVTQWAATAGYRTKEPKAPSLPRLFHLGRRTDELKSIDPTLKRVLTVQFLERAQWTPPVASHQS